MMIFSQTLKCFKYYSFLFMVESGFLDFNVAKSSAMELLSFLMSAVVDFDKSYFRLFSRGWGWSVN